MLFVKSKVQLFRVGDNDYSLKLKCNCAVLFVSRAIVEGMKKRGLPPRLGIWKGSIGCTAKLLGGCTFH
jgi:hypothetical protein